MVNCKNINWYTCMIYTLYNNGNNYNLYMLKIYLHKTKYFYMENVAKQLTKGYIPSYIKIDIVINWCFNQWPIKAWVLHLRNEKCINSISWRSRNYKKLIRPWTIVLSMIGEGGLHTNVYFGSTVGVLWKTNTEIRKVELVLLPNGYSVV